MRFTARPSSTGESTRPGSGSRSSGTCSVGWGWCGHCQLGPLLLCRDGPVVPYGGVADELFMERNGDAGGSRLPGAHDARPTLAVWKFASCDGCQLSLLDCEDELLALAGAVRIAHFTEMSRATVDGPYDVSLVEGSITTPSRRRADPEIRANSRRLITIGACASAGGIQALRNFAAEGAYVGAVYAHPEYISSLSTSTPISAHVAVDSSSRDARSTATSSSR
jgi:Ni,Fe-hydrogenase III small subunit